MNFAAALARLLPEELRAAPPPGLVPDVGLPLLTRERRRSDCALLDPCELAWSQEHGELAGMCPTTCVDYRRRVAP